MTDRRFRQLVAAWFVCVTLLFIIFLKVGL